MKSLARAVGGVMLLAPLLVALPESPAASQPVPAMHVFLARGASDAHSAKPGGGSSSNLSSHGGAVETAPVIYLSYWGPEWKAGFQTCASPSNCYTSLQAANYVESFFGAVGGSSWINSTTQYCQGVATGTTTCPLTAAHITNPTGQLKLPWNDLTPVPSSPTQADIANAALRAQAHFGYSANATYFVLTPTGKSMPGFKRSWCAWHSSTSSSYGTVAYAYLPYQPDGGSSCGVNFINATNNAFGNGYFDGFSVVGGHEYAEAETDPAPNSGWVNGSGSENGDLCAWNPSSANITLGSNNFAVQPLWSNAFNSGAGGCVLSYRSGAA